MTCDHPAATLLPFYLNGTLGPEDLRRVETHLAACFSCSAELAMWHDVSDAVRADAWVLPGVSDHSWQRLATHHRASTASRVGYLAALVAAQVRVVGHGLWMSSAVVMALGFAVAWTAGRSGMVGALAPLVAVFGVSHLHGPQHDPAFELTEATPTSPRVVLLARLVLVFGYDLGLALAASAGLTLALPDTFMGTLIWSWLAPMTFLSALALLGSVLLGSHAGVSLALGLWLVRGFISGAASTVPAMSWAAAYQAWWTQSSWLFALAGLMGLSGIWLAGSRERRLPAT